MSSPKLTRGRLVLLLAAAAAAAAVVAVAAAMMGSSGSDTDGTAGSGKRPSGSGRQPSSAERGVSTSEAPYLVPGAPGVDTRSILTVGDEVGGYRMVGRPDGLGAFDNGDGTFTVLMDHEVEAGASSEHAHGATGAFVSRWVIDKRSLKVRSGGDLIKGVAVWDESAGTHQAPTKGISLGKLCSADLPLPGALYDSRSGKGYKGRIFFSGEETGTGGRAFGHVLDGTSYELAHMGNYSFENIVLNPGTGDRTVAVGTDDTTPGQVYVYVGTKRSTGNPVERAGMTGGRLYGVKVAGTPEEDGGGGIPSGTRFELAEIENASTRSGEEIETMSDAAGVTRWLRPEDSAWDPSRPDRLYFTTTNAIDAPSRLWRLNFDDPRNPAAGGTVDMLLDGTEGQKMLDNLTVDSRGDVVVQEDPGDDARLARVHRYSVDSDELTTVARVDPARFRPGAAKLLTQDEESSGVIDASAILGPGWYLADVQAHYDNPDRALVEGGQLLAMRIG